MQKDDQNKIYRTLDNYISKQVFIKRNQNKSWVYGYDLKHDLVVISKDGTVGEICEINGVKIGLPTAPKKIYKNIQLETTKY